MASTVRTVGADRLSRRRFIQVLGATGLAAVGSGTGIGHRVAGAHAEPQAANLRFAAEFANPQPEIQAGFRWWWPHGLVDPEEIRREIDQIADAGFGRVEITDVHHSVTEPIDPGSHGWGTPAWNAGVEAALEQGAERGVIVDITAGPAWPPAVPTITPDSVAAAKELAHGMAVVEGGGTFAAQVPEPVVAAAPDVKERHLVAVQAARVADGSSPEARPVVIVPDSVTDLTHHVVGDQLTWTAPDGGQWLVISYWERGTGQRPERGPHTEPLSYVVDHLDASGVGAVTDFWSSNLLTPTVRKLLPRIGGAIFEDSIEMETDATLWTPSITREFEKRRGYELRPYLPAIVDAHGKAAFQLGDAETSRRVRYDFEEVLTDLFVENHLEPLQDWAHSLGMKLRIQPAGMRTDSIFKAALVDIPEGESLGFNNLDDFRSLAGGRDMGGREILASEVGAFTNGAYSTTWQRMLRELCGEYAAGVNLAMLHGFSYAEAPGASWPGFAAFSPYDDGPGYSESWGPRQPTWRHVPAIAAHLARIQGVLRSGTSRVDAAVLRQRGYAGTGVGAPWFTAGMGASPTGLGWTHQFISPRLLELPTATVSGGRLAPEGPAYKVIVLEVDVFGGREASLEVRTAERLVELAKAGLPIILVGAWDDARVPGIPKSGENARLQALVDELITLSTVRRVDDRSFVGDALDDLGLEPDAVYSERSSLLTAHRAAPDVDYYYFSNGIHAASSVVEPVEHMVSLTRAHPDAVPYRLDTWTGQIERLALYEEEGSHRVRVPVRLLPGETTIVAIGRRTWHNDRAGRGLHAVHSDANAVRFADGDLVVRTSAPGRFSTTLSNGQTVRTEVGEVPPPQTLTTWDLEVEDWQPGDSPTETLIVRHEQTVGELKPWSDISELEDVSGVGRYHTTVDLSGWTDSHGAYLDLGEITDTAVIKVNGEELAVDVANPVVDVGPHLRAGANVVEVEVATPLLNRLRVANPSVFGSANRQQYGLMGPVRLVPYTDTRVWPRPN